MSPRRFLSAGCGWKAVEGPHLFKKGDFWYLLLAEGGTESNHRVTISRSESPWGPWSECPHNPILCHSGIQSPIQNTGHADLFEGHNGRWWIAFLGVRPIGYPSVHITGRETFIAPVDWSPDGWPSVNHGEPISLTTPSADKSTVASLLWVDDFTSTRLHHRWVTLGSAYRSIYSVDGNGGLRLHATTKNLSTKSIRAFVGTRLDGHCRRYETCLRTPDPNAEAGIAVFMETFGYYALSISEESENTAKATFTRRVLDMEIIRQTSIPKREEYKLRVELTQEGSFWSFEFSEFVFSIERRNGEWEEVGRGTSRLLSSEVIGGFTGLLVGMFCVSTDPSIQPAAHFTMFAMSGTQ